MPRKKKSDPEVVPVSESPAPEVVVEVAEEPFSFIDHLLSLEDSVRAEADAVEPSENSDALKAALRNAAHGIGHVRKARDQIAAMAR